VPWLNAIRRLKGGRAHSARQLPARLGARRREGGAMRGETRALAPASPGSCPYPA
jgi:hypothetical protein